MKILLEIPSRLITGYLWLFEIIPLTAIIIIPAGLVMILMDMKVEVSSNSILLAVTSILLIDGYIGHRNAEKKEQKKMHDFYSWHFDEMKKGKKEEE